MLRVIASERIEPLVADLARELVENPADPMTPEWIAVGSDGLERWLRLELAKHLGATTGRSDGVAANITMSRPGALRTAVVLAGTSEPDHDPWLTNQLVWSVLETLHEHGPTDPVLSRFVDGSSRSTYGRARQIAARFSAYQTYRPEMIRSWMTGDDVDASGRPLRAGQAWQPHLWRLVRSHVGTESHAERLTTGLEVVTKDRSALRTVDGVLPPRLIFFGPSLLPTGAGFLEVAEAVAVLRDVLVYVIEPSASLSRDLRSGSDEMTASYDRSHDVSAGSAVHPLLRSWGRLQRETALLLSGQPLEVTEIGDRRDDSLLHALQSQIHDNDEPANTFIHSTDDRSIAVHRCYGPTRQVEVLKDTLLGLLADPRLDLVEDDVVVACPSIETFAPLIRAHFGPSATEHTATTDDGTPTLRYRITGLSTGRDNPVTDALLAALDLCLHRFDVDEVSDFLAMPAVMNRLGWTADDLGTIDGWLADTNVRWGLDGDHRAPFGLSRQVDAYTWRTALDQLVMGTVVRSEVHLTVGHTVPIDFAAGSDRLVGQLAGVIARLENLNDAGHETRPIREWFEMLDELMGALLASDPDDDRQMESTRRQLQRVVDNSRLSTKSRGSGDAALPEPSDTPVSLQEVAEMLGDVVGEQRGRSEFFRGGITITTFNALRNVPARVICLLGADQGAFTSGGVETDDLIGTNPRLGDRDPRAEVRQTLLDALLAARDRFILFCDHRDVRTNSNVPPAVVVSELFEVIDAMCATIDEPGGADQGSDGIEEGSPAPGTVSRRITTDHRRQPFDEIYFDDEAGPIRSFDRSSLLAAEARRDRDTAHGDPVWFSVMLDHPVVEASEHVTLDALKRVVKDPTKVFLTDGLGIRLPGEVDIRSNQLPLEPSGLDDWKLGTELLDLITQGSVPESWDERKTKLGSTPPLALGRAHLAGIRGRATATVAAARANGFIGGTRRAAELEMDIGDQRRLIGGIELGGCNHPDLPDEILWSMSFSRAKNQHVLEAWIDLLALRVISPAAPAESIIVNSPGRPTKDDPTPLPRVRHLRLDDIDADTARSTLILLTEIYDTAVRQPVPLFPEVLGPDHDDRIDKDAWSAYQRPLSDENLFVYGDISVWDMLRLEAPGHPVVPSGAKLAHAYAERLWDAFEETAAVARDETFDPEEQ